MRVLAVIMARRDGSPGRTLVGVATQVLPGGGCATLWTTATGRRVLVVADPGPAACDAQFVDDVRFRRSAGWTVTGGPVVVEVPDPDPGGDGLEQWMRAAVLPLVLGAASVAAVEAAGVR